MISLKVTGVKNAILSLPNKRKIERAAAQALNKAGRAAVTETDRGIRDDYTVKQKEIRSALRSTKATPSNLSFIIRADNRRLSLLKYQHRISKTRRRPGVASVRVAVRKSGLKPLHGAFHATTETGYTGIFRRKGRERYPIRKLTGPSIAALAKTRKVQRKVEARVGPVFETEFRRQLERK